MEERVWHFQLAGKSIGPLTLEQLEAEFLSRRLPPSTLVWKHPLEEWKSAGDFGELTFLASPRCSVAASMKAALPTAISVGLASLVVWGAYAYSIASGPSAIAHPMVFATNLLLILVRHFVVASAAVLFAGAIRRGDSPLVVIAAFLLGWIVLGVVLAVPGGVR